MTRDFHWLTSFARLKDGVTLEQAQANMNAIGARIAKDFPDSNKGWGVIVERYGDTLVGPDLRTALLVLMTATGLVLLIGCANLANLALARGVSREREVASARRSAPDAGGWSANSSPRTSSSRCAAVCSASASATDDEGLQMMLPAVLVRPRRSESTMDMRVMVFALAVSMFTGLLFGLAPACRRRSRIWPRR